LDVSVRKRYKIRILRGDVMNEKRVSLIDEEPKHRKKSKSKGQPRSKHKHTYETVLLRRDWYTTNFKTGHQEIRQITLPTKVCNICGRIDETDSDPSYYVKTQMNDKPFVYFNKELSEKALSLPKWYVNDYFDKFATKMED
jgi:hypothetical protein